MIVGIDLGTTNSLVAVWKDGQPQLIPNALEERLTPSAVSIGKTGELLLGKGAKERWLSDAQQAAVTFKRHMGSQKQYQLGDYSLRPEELSALVLKSLKADAEHWLGEPVDEAVITVPAYFSDAQRTATRQAGEIAGLKVRRLVNEPTAAAMAYGLMDAPPESTFMVLDLGGGTFDVAILERFEDLLEVRASTGDNFLGGEDFVEVIVQQAYEIFPELPRDTGSPAYSRLWHEAERLKRELGSASEATFSFQHEGNERQFTLSASDYENACLSLLQRLRHPVERALRDAGLRAADIDDVVLAGGATRMPMVRSLVARMFGRMPAIHLNPDEVIVRGAAMMAGMVARDESLEETVMVDVCPYSLGVDITSEVNGRLQSGYFDPIIERNTSVPVSRESVYSTLENNQQNVKFKIYQGESRLTRDNILLGELEVKVPPRPAREVNIIMRFTYDVSGILECEATIPETNEVKRLVLQGNDASLSEEEVNARFARLAEIKVHPREQQVNMTLLARADRLHQELLGDARRFLAERLQHFEAVLESQHLASIKAARQQLEELLDSLELYKLPGDDT